MLEDVSARTVHAVLHSVREISGKQYDHLLEHAGWARFRAGIPPVSDELIATRTELESLFANVYALLGEKFDPALSTQLRAAAGNAPALEIHATGGGGGAAAGAADGLVYRGDDSDEHPQLDAGDPQRGCGSLLHHVRALPALHGGTGHA